MHGWLNIYKPRGISSAKAVAIVKKQFKNVKVGHTGTLDLEAEGVLPLALGEATKLVSILIDAKKEYEFTVKFGAKTDTADSAGKIIATTDKIPSKEECLTVCDEFIGEVEQTPPAYSALKVNGKRAYSLAREGKSVELQPRKINIYSLKCTNYDVKQGVATYICTCSKGTYIRTLAEDISFYLQSLGFVLELRRSKVGMFDLSNSLNIEKYVDMDYKDLNIKAILECKSLKVEAVLDDIPVLDANEKDVQTIRYGQVCYFNNHGDAELVWVRFNGQIIAIGSLFANQFKPSRVFNHYLAI